MGKQTFVDDSDGNPRYIRETSDDGSKSELFEIDNSLAAIFSEDHRGKRVEVADHHPNGTTTAYEADNGLYANSILGNGGRGRDKSLPAPEQRRREESSYEAPSDSDDDDGEISEETIERMVELMAEAIREAREEAEEEREYERRRQRDLEARVEREKRTKEILAETRKGGQEAGYEYDARLGAIKNSGLDIEPKTGQEAGYEYDARLKATVEAGMLIRPKTGQEAGYEYDARLRATVESRLPIEPKTGQEAGYEYDARLRATVISRTLVSPKQPGESSSDYDKRIRDIIETHTPKPTPKVVQPTQIVQNTSSSNSSSSCFIATTVYGDINAPEVQTLRNYRDNVLMQTDMGKRFVKFYYSGAGERTARVISRHLPTTIPLIRKGLDFIVNSYDSQGALRHKSIY